MLGFSQRLDFEVSHVPLLEWKSVLHCIIQGFYACSQRSDWRESKVKNVWKEVAAFCEFSLKGWPYQDVRYEDEQGRAGESVLIAEELPF